MKADITNTIEIFDDKNVRIDYKSCVTSVTLSDKSAQIFVIPPDTTDYAINIVQTGLEFIAIFPSAEVTIKINGTTGVDERIVHDFFLMRTEDVDTVYITNSDTENSVTVEVFQGNEAA